MIIVQLAVLFILAGLAFLVITPWTAWLWLILGILLGLAIVYGDEHYSFRLYLDPRSSPQTRMGLVTRSLLFLLVFGPLALFVVTSSGSLIGQGMVTAMAVVYATELWQWRRDEAGFARKFLWQTKAVFDQRERNFSAVIMMVLVGLLGFLILF